MPFIRHGFVSGKSDGADPTVVKPSNWNARIQYEKGGSPTGIDAMMREALVADRTYYVRTDGSDTNDGLTNNAGGAFLTIGHAFDATHSVDANNKRLIIQLSTGTFAAPTVLGIVPMAVVGPTPSWEGYIEFYGADASGGTNITGNISIQNGVSIFIDNMAVQGFIAYDDSRVGYASTAVGLIMTQTTGSHFESDLGSSMYIDGNYTISGGAKNHYLGFDGYLESAGIVTLLSSPSFTNYFCKMGGASYSEFKGSFIGTASTVTFRYNASEGSIINTFGAGANYFPGTVLGSTSTFGDYL